MFWIGLAIAFIGALLDLGTTRNFIRRFSSKLTDIYLDVIVISMIMIGLFISASQFHQTSQKEEAAEDKIDGLEQELKGANATIATLRDYGHIAELNCLGKTGMAGVGLYESPTPLSRLLENAWVSKNGKWYASCDSVARNRFETVIKDFPKFPFSYYAIAVCLRSVQDERWKDYAEKATAILEKTSAISKHTVDHDEALKALERYLEEVR